MEYTIVWQGRSHCFSSLEDANKFASDIFNKTGIVVGVELRQPEEEGCCGSGCRNCPY
jgi:hypothetical protein